MSGLRGLGGMSVVLTGGGSGIGRAIALRLGKEGCRVAILDIDADGGAATASAMTEAGGHASAFAVDITDYRSENYKEGAKKDAPPAKTDGKGTTSSSGSESKTAEKSAAATKSADAGKSSTKPKNT